MTRVADTQYNPMQAPSHPIPLPVPSGYGMGLHSLSVPSSPLGSVSETLLLSPGSGAKVRERSHSIPMHASLGVVGGSPVASRRNTAAGASSDVRRLSDKIADQRRRQAESERQLAEILGPSPPSVVLGEARVQPALAPPQHHTEPSLDWSDFAQLSLSLSLRDLTASAQDRQRQPDSLPVLALSRMSAFGRALMSSMH